jgi:hypothetical protein
MRNVPRLPHNEDGQLDRWSWPVIDPLSQTMTLKILSTYEPNMMATITTEGEDLCMLSGDPSWISRQLALHVQTWARAQTIR